MPAAAAYMARGKGKKKMNPADSPYGATWYAETMVEAPERAPLVYDLDVDVCVIGGGLAGLTVAREVARRGWSVAVLEAERIAWSASGRNGGMVLPGFAEGAEQIVERVGLERAKALWGLSLDGVDYVRDAIDETGMPGVDPVDGWLYVQRVEGGDRAARAAALVGDTFGTEVEVWEIDQVREVLRSERYFQALHFPDAFHIHPLNYALGLAAAAESDGGRIFERTRALAIDPDGVRKRIDTTGARVRARHVVLGGSAHLAPLFPLVADAVLPVVTYLATTAPLGERLREVVAYPGAVVDMRAVPGYFRIVDGDRLMWGGRVAHRGATAQQAARMMQRHIREVFPQLGDVEIAHAWSGTMGYAMHRMPLIGEISPGLWVATAFGGHGINTSAMAGDLITRAIIDGDDRWRLFASYDLVWAAGRLGTAAKQATYWFMQARDWVEEKISRRRYAAQMRLQRIAAGVADEAKRKVAAEAARIAGERAERRATLVAEEAARRDAAEAARLAADAAEREAVRASRLAEAEAVRLATVQKAELAAVKAEQHALEELRIASEQTGEAAAEAVPALVAEEHRRALELARLTEVEAERQGQADAAQRAAEEAERAAATAARAAADEAVRLTDAHAARIAADEAERAAVAEEAATLRLATEKAEQEAVLKAAQKKPRAAARPRKRRAAEQVKPRPGEPAASAGAPAVRDGAEEPAPKPARKRPARVTPRPATTDRIEADVPNATAGTAVIPAEAQTVPENVPNVPEPALSADEVRLPVDNGSGSDTSQRKRRRSKSTP